ncbi:hypothetical protein UFOVP237_39 [uncultured Caudovirales phage]|uniref:Uncharacterized protein n=1 Tax=uncultured Caudovirales phage TaxID=2100421 RepID=A0A6J7WPX0_9CAUD|nr:hypothetical protein UFOVP237_39 [uncultured Caudovirales phage]
MDYIYIGPSPADEPCAQTGVTEGAERLNKLECRAYIDALRIVYGPEPEGAWLTIKRESHDYGDYFEVVCKYIESDDVATDYAYRLENGLGTWAEAEMKAPVQYDDRRQPVGIAA